MSVSSERTWQTVVFGLSILASACGTSAGAADGGPGDANPVVDSGTAADAGGTDAAGDTGVMDARVEMDTGSAVDSGGTDAVSAVDGSGGQGSLHWSPGYYVLLAGSTAAARDRALADPEVVPFAGLQIRYPWYASEAAPMDYSAGFAALDADLAAVSAAHTKLLVFLTYKNFDGTRAVPADLTQSGGAWCSGTYCGDFSDSTGGTRIPLFWNAAVEQRLTAWLHAMAAHAAASPYRDSIAGFVLPETAVPGMSADWTAAQYSADAYLSALEQNMSAVRAGAPDYVVFIYTMAGFHPAADSTGVPYMDRFCDWMVAHRGTGMGASDWAPNYNSPGHPCLDTRYSGRIPCDPAIESPDYSTMRTDSLAASIAFALDPAPNGAFAPYVTVSYTEGPGTNAFTFSDVSAYIATHPMPNTALPSWQ